MQILDTVHNANIDHTSSGTEVLNLSKEVIYPRPNIFDVSIFKLKVSKFKHDCEYFWKLLKFLKFYLETYLGHTNKILFNL